MARLGITPTTANSMLTVQLGQSYVSDRPTFSWWLVYAYSPLVQTLHGPSSGNFDEAADIPLLMTDWSK